MTEKEQIIKDFLNDWYNMEQFAEEHPELKDVKFKSILSFLIEIQLNDYNSIYNVEHVFSNWVQGQYIYSKTKAKAIVSIIQDFKDFWNQTSNHLNRDDYYVQAPIYQENLLKMIEYHIINNNIKSVNTYYISFA